MSSNSKHWKLWKHKKEVEQEGDSDHFSSSLRNVGSYDRKRTFSFQSFVRVAGIECFPVFQCGSLDHELNLLDNYSLSDPHIPSASPTVLSLRNEAEKRIGATATEGRANERENARTLADKSVINSRNKNQSNSKPLENFRKKLTALNLSEIETDKDDDAESPTAKQNVNLDAPFGKSLVTDDGSKVTSGVERRAVSMDARTERRAISMDTGVDRGMRLSNLVKSEHFDISSMFEFGSVLGKGASGVVRLCTESSTRKAYACKSVNKSSLKCQLDVKDLQSEVRSLKIMQQHPHAVRLKGVFEDERSVHIVMEYCEGGDLFARLKQRRFYTEPEAAVICRTLASVLAFAHDHGIMHRDLKPENILMPSPDLDIDICLADFGSAAFFKPGQRLNQLIGSPLYIAPSVLQHSYGKEADLWSLGVILYILLSGTPPFIGRNNAEMFKNIQHGQLEMHAERWTVVSKGAKKLVSRLLTRDDEKRLSAKQVLNHPWILFHCGKDDPIPRVPARKVKSPFPSNSKPPISPNSNRGNRECSRHLTLVTQFPGRVRRHSIGSSEIDEQTFDKNVEVARNDAVEPRTDEKRTGGRSVLRRSPTPFRPSSKFNADFNRLSLQNDESSLFVRASPLGKKDIESWASQEF